MLALLYLATTVLLALLGNYGIVGITWQLRQCWHYRYLATKAMFALLYLATAVLLALLGNYGIVGITWQLRYCWHYLATTAMLALLGNYGIVGITWQLQYCWHYLATTVLLTCQEALLMLMIYYVHCSHWVRKPGKCLKFEKR